MIETNGKPIYYTVVIRATSAKTEIWLGDDEGHYVQKEVGVLESHLLPGDYTVEFGLGGTCYPICLNKNTEYAQSGLEAGLSCARPVPEILPG
jgi:hypothetical protein